MKYHDFSRSIFEFLLKMKFIKREALVRELANGKIRVFYW